MQIRMDCRGAVLFTSLSLILLLINKTWAKEVQDGRKVQLLKQPRETNPFNFMRLLVMRLVYGIAKMIGFEDSLEEVANGAFIPPGVDDDYGGFDLDARDDYDYKDYKDDYY